jgi:hypothetical protein
MFRQVSQVTTLWTSAGIALQAAGGDAADDRRPQGV